MENTAINSDDPTLLELYETMPEIRLYFPNGLPESVRSEDNWNVSESVLDDDWHRNCEMGQCLYEFFYKYMHHVPSIPVSAVLSNWTCLNFLMGAGVAPWTPVWMSVNLYLIRAQGNYDYGYAPEFALRGLFEQDIDILPLAALEHFMAVAVDLPEDSEEMHKIFEDYKLRLLKRQNLQAQVSKNNDYSL